MRGPKVRRRIRALAATAVAGVLLVGIAAATSWRLAVVAALAAGAIAPIEPGETLADGLGGNVEPGSVTFELVRDHVAAVALVSEAEIADALRLVARAHGLVAEGAAAVAVAGVMTGRVPRGDGPLVVILTGRNIALPRLAAIFAES